MAVLQNKTPCSETDWGKHRQGYGQKWINGKHWLHHRYVWTEYHGEIPKGLVIRHLCHNTGCVNIEHLAIGTQKDNRQDDIDIGKTFGPMMPGETNPNSKLTKTQIAEIRDSKDRVIDIAKKYGVHRQTIYTIRRGETWKHLS